MGQNPYRNSLLSTVNSSTSVLANGATFTGTWEEQVGYGEVSVYCKTDKTGTLYLEFSSDASTTDRSTQFSIVANEEETHRDDYYARYFRVRFTNNSGSTQSYLTLKSYFKNHAVQSLPLTDELSIDADAITTRTVLYGKNDNNEYSAVPITAEGHLEIALHEPLLPFGSLHAESLTPVFQVDAVYGINSFHVTNTTSGSGTATASDSCFVVSTGTTIYSQGVIQSRKRLRYRAGQGVIARFTALYTTPVASSYQLVGIGHAEDGLYIGYKDTDFGILYTNRGARAVYTLTVTTGATVASNATVTLNGTANVVALTAASNIQRTVWELSQGTYSGWDAYPSGATVVFVAKAAGTTAGSFSYSAGTTGSAASIAQTRAGASETQSFITQANFNMDTLDGNGPSGMRIDPTKLNVFQVNVQYLGAGALEFKVENAPSGNNATMVSFHTINLPNTLTTTSFRNPSFPFTMAAYSAGSTTNLTVKCGSFAGFIEGHKYLHGVRQSYFNQLTTVGSTNYQALFTVMNARYFGGIANQAVINIISVSGALKHTSPVIFYLIRQGSLAGNPNFTSPGSNSCSLQDSSATTVSGGEIIWSGHLGDTGELDHHFNGGGAEEFTLQPGEWVTLAAKATTGTPSWVTGSINTREDQ